MSLDRSRRNLSSRFVGSAAVLGHCSGFISNQADAEPNQVAPRVSVPSIIVVGAEGSGTTLLWNCVVCHPQLRHMQQVAVPAAGPLAANGVILHLSLPTLRPMRWVGGWALPRGVRVVVIRRSPVHAVFSAYRRFYRYPRSAWRHYLRAVALEASWIARHEPLCIAYEDLVFNRANVFRRVYEHLGIDAGFVPPIEIADRNDDRWRQDPRFAACMRRAFGLELTAEENARADTPSVTLDFGCHGSRITIEDASEAGVAKALQAALPPAQQIGSDDQPVVRYRVERRTGKAGAVGYRIVANGAVSLRTRDKQRVVAWLRAEIEQTIAERARESLFVHAGVVGWRGFAIVIPGRSMTGKSRLVTELVRCGATYYSDEFAVFDHDGDVLPYAREAVLRDPGVEIDLGARDASAALPVALIVSTTYRADAAWHPLELRGVRAVVPIIDNTVLARRETRRLMALSARIAPRVVTLQGPRPDATAVAPRLLAYLDELLAGAAPPAHAEVAVVDRASQASRRRQRGAFQG